MTKRQWRENLVGKTFGRLTVRSEASQGYVRRWVCRCVCGVEKTIGHRALKAGQTRSCGCWRGEKMQESKTTHGKTGTVLYRIWASMIARCTISSATGFSRYGAAGVSVCARWRVFQNFADDMGERPAGHSIDRFPDGKGNYEPGNCRWATRQQQNENRSSVRWIEFDGKRMNVAQWSRYLGINKSTLIEALAKHPVEVALRSRA